MKLYLYQHCPFCIRPRIVAGFKKIPLDLIFLANDDEKAHLDLIGKKQVPFLQKENGNFLIESLDICQYLNNFDRKPILSQEIVTTDTLIKLISDINNTSKSVVYPRFINHPQNHQDFPTQSAKDYFEHKKEKYIGCFKASLRFPQASIDKTTPLLDVLNTFLTHPFASGDQLSWDDIMLFPVLRNLTIIQDLITIPSKVKHYIKNICQLTGIQPYQ